MNSLQSLAVCMSISGATSTILLSAIARPLDNFIDKMCPDGETMGFWVRFTMVMLYLTPLFFTVSIGMPSAFQLKSLELGELIQRAVTATLVGAFFAMIGMGFWVSSLARRASVPMQTNTKPANC